MVMKSVQGMAISQIVYYLSDQVRQTSYYP